MANESWKRRRLRRDGAVDPPSRPVASCALRARPELPQLGLRLAHVPLAGDARPDRPTRGARRRTASPLTRTPAAGRLPFLLIEYAHAMGNGPGSLQDYQRIMAAHERICGGFVWEWIDHGFHATAADGTATHHARRGCRLLAVGGRFTPGRARLQRPHARRLGLIELAKAYAPMSIRVGSQIEIENDRPTAGTSDLAFRLDDRRRRRPGAGGAPRRSRSTREPERSNPLPDDLRAVRTATREVVLVGRGGRSSRPTSMGTCRGT